MLYEAIAYLGVINCDLIGRLSTTNVVPGNNQITTQMRRLIISTPKKRRGLRQCEATLPSSSLYLRRHKRSRGSLIPPFNRYN